MTSPSLGILRVRLFLSCSRWLTFDANTLFFSHNALCTSVALLLPQSLGPDLFGPMAFWVIVQFVGIHHKPKEFRILKLLCMSSFCAFETDESIHVGVYIPFVLCVSILTSYSIVCVCVLASSCFCCVQESVKRRVMKADIAVSQKAQQNKYRDMADSTRIKCGIRHNSITCQMVKKAGTDVFNEPRAFLLPDRDHNMLYPVDESAKRHVITSAICHSKTIAAWIAIALAS